MIELTPHLPPFSSEAMPPTGGYVGPSPEHFVVEEQLLYQPCGEGDHAYLFIQKRQLTTDEAVTQVAKLAGCSVSDVGYAGMKDKHAVTRQWISVPRQVAANLTEGPLSPSLSILAKTYHTNKLRTGHLTGNRFEITLVQTAPGAAVHAQDILQLLQEKGLPNYFGAQRFGHGGQNLARAHQLFFGARTGQEGPARARIPHRQSKLFASVLQSEVFNRYLTVRSNLGVQCLLSGEVVRLDGKNAVFTVTDPAAEQARLDAGDLHPTGPLWGKKMKLASAEVLALELAALEEIGLTREDFDRLGRFAPGARRDCLVRPERPTVAETADGLCLSFGLTSGSYATQVIRELTRHPFVANPRPTVNAS